MRIGIDAMSLGNQRDGSQTYILNLIRALAAIDSHNDYTIFIRPGVPSVLLAGLERMRTVVVSPPTQGMRIPFALGRAVGRSGVDLLHVQFAAPLFCPVRTVVTIHDLLFVHHPEWFDRRNLWQLRLRVPLSVRRSAAICTGSEFSRRDIISHFKIPPGKVVVAYTAPAPSFRPVHDQDRLRATRHHYRTGDHFLLYVGALKPNKNVQAVLAAYLRLRQTEVITHRLVLTGSGEMRHDAVFDAIRQAGHADDIVFTGYVPDDELVALYNAADLFLQPSLYEGYGLPSVEAMACGTPVITSSAAAVPEVVGDGALLVDPHDVGALARAIERVLTDPALRAQLAERGLARAATFTWEKNADTMLEVYDRVVHTRRTPIA